MMAGSHTVYTVTVNRGRISVDVDRYTFTFVCHRADHGLVKLTVCGSMVHGKQSPRVQADDRVAQQARREAECVATTAVTHWLREHPSGRLADLAEEVIWLRPDYPRLTAAERATNQVMIGLLIGNLAIEMTMPKDDETSLQLP